MILFATLRTRRVSVNLKELTIGETIKLLSLPADMLEAGTTEFLRFVAADIQAPTRNHVTDPRLMTVQERMMLSAHYIAHVSEDGPDFSIESARLSSYLLPDTDWDGKPALVDGDTVWPLLGWQAELLEQVCTDRGAWQIGVIACQLYSGAEKPPDGAAISTADGHAWLAERRRRLSELSDSDFVAALTKWRIGDSTLTHFFGVGLQDDGLTALPRKEAGDIAPARFPFIAGISDVAISLFGKPLQPRR